MYRKGIIFALFLFMLFSAAEVCARSLIVPSAYGYSVVHTSGRRAYSPRRTHYYSAYYPGYYPWAQAQLPYYWGGTPAWNGAYWYYSHGYSLAATSADLNIRTEPRVPKKRKANVIGTLRAGEQVYLLGSSGSWYYIQSVYAPLRRGYVHGNYLYSSAPATPIAYYAYNW